VMPSSRWVDFVETGKALDTTLLFFMAAETQAIFLNPQGEQKTDRSKNSTWKFFVLGLLHYILTGQDGDYQRQQ
jgi:hypothetical protein